METDIAICVLTCLGVNGGVQGQQLVKEQKILILPPKSCIFNLVPQDVLRDFQ